MTRIMKWGIGRYHRLSEMCAAIHLLAGEDLDALDGRTSFTIRSEAVTLTEVRRYFRRKGISDPAAHVKQRPDEDSFADEDVVLDTKISKSDPPQEARQLLTPSDSSQSQATASPPVGSERETTQPGAECLDLQPSANIHIKMTTFRRDFERILWSVAAYIGSYSSSVRRTQHIEPQVHHLTVYGKFGARFQEGISLMTRANTGAAFQNFRQAFALLKDYLADDHPMSLALILTLICELERNNLHAVTIQLANHIVGMVKLREHTSHPIIVLFQALGRSGNATSDNALRALRRARDDLLLTTDRQHYWQCLYLEERLCDALYYAGENYERLSSRRRLHEDQVQKYGANARNVLWTQTMVADDLLQVGRTEEAIAEFEDVLVRANQLDGYGKAKTRFAALEGLASAHYYRGCQATMSSSTGGIDILNALQHLEQAEQEASLWFETSSRRLERVRDQKRMITESLGLLLPVLIDDGHGFLADEVFAS